eukprot:TRINITY_DN3964_c0_g1_i1.p1 TRINITY_DN3964_c0_g1~~TRINITY_DN3964_c0_g1_i1.p1  ORF type:complete len:462 (+),score=128.90 TRINITY_DN3964_c0_g1_i1:69-1388(+)
MDAPTLRKFWDPADRYAKSRRLGGVDFGHDSMAAYCIVGGDDAAAAEAAALLRAARDGGVPSELDRGMGCVLGNVVGDALGAPLEFSSVRYGVDELRGMEDESIWRKPGYNSFSLQPGQWTDDASMGLCLMDSLLCSGRFDAMDLRQRFHAWNRFGYNNAFGRDADRFGRGSVGLGGNISMSMAEWTTQDAGEMTRAGNMFTSGNGSVMRNGAVPVWFADDVRAGMDAAYRQSRTTHRGEEAAELCRLLTFICTKFIKGAGKDMLDDMREFESPSYAVTCMRDGRCEESHPQNKDPIFGGLERRRWNWKDADYRYCDFRARSQPGYIGSYAMDAVAMALHALYHTDSFAAATLKVANLRGDSDSVCAVVGQLAGALYGVSAIPQPWLDRVQRWDGGSIAARALMLCKHRPVETALSDGACATTKLLGKPTGPPAAEAAA